MRHLLFLFTICLLLWLGSPSPLDPKRWLINRPTEDMIFSEKRSKRLTSEYTVKSAQAPLGERKGYSHPQRHLLPNVRKGEYVCGDKICKLEPGKIPKNCNGICQYPLSLESIFKL